MTEEQNLLAGTNEPTEKPAKAKKPWERPILYRMDAADAEGPAMGSGADGMANMS